VWESVSILVWDCFDFFCYVGTCFHSDCQLLSQLTNAGYVGNGADQSALALLELLTNTDIISYISVHSRSMLLYIIDKLMAVPTARVARMLAPLAFSTGHQLVGGVAPKPPFVHMYSSTHVFCLSPSLLKVQYNSPFLLTLMYILLYFGIVFIVFTVLLLYSIYSKISSQLKLLYIQHSWTLPLCPSHSKWP
jgi:hypothetical protein